MKKSGAIRIAAICLATGCSASRGAEESGPHGWPLVYSQDFEEPASERAFRSPDSDGWRRGAEAGNSFLEMSRPGSYEPPHRSPQGLAILATPVLESFVLEARWMQTGPEYPHRDLIFAFAFRDAEHYHYAHLASQADENAHHVQVVDAAPRRPVTTARSSGVDWGRGAWRRLRIERDAERGSIRVWLWPVDGTREGAEPALVAEGTAPGFGWIGFGSFDDTGRFDDVRIWAPRALEQELADFRAIGSGEERR